MWWGEGVAREKAFMGVCLPTGADVSLWRVRDPAPSSGVFS